MQEQYEFCPLSTDTAADNARTISFENARLESVLRTWNDSTKERERNKVEKKTRELKRTNKMLDFFLIWDYHGLLKNKIARFNFLEMYPVRALSCLREFVRRLQ